MHGLCHQSLNKDIYHDIAIVINKKLIFFKRVLYVLKAINLIKKIYVNPLFLSIKQHIQSSSKSE